MLIKIDVSEGVDLHSIPENCPECHGDVILDQDYYHCENWCVEQEAPMFCPSCGSDEIFGDGCAFNCESCGYVWGHESRRPLLVDPPQRRLS